MAAKKAEIVQLDLATIGVAPEQVGLAHAATAVTTAVTKPSREQGEIIRENSETAAKKIVDFLAAENLI